MAVRSWPSASFAQGAGHLAFRVALGDGGALVVMLAAAYERQLHLGDAVLEIETEGNQRKALLLHRARELADLHLVEQELALARRLVAVGAGGGVLRDVRVHQPELAALGTGIGLAQVDAAEADRLDLAAHEREAGLDALEH